MKYLQAEVNQNLFDITEAMVYRNRTSSTAAISAHYNINYYAKRTADIMYLNSPITGAVIRYTQQNIHIKHKYLHYCAFKIHIFDQF